MSTPEADFQEERLTAYALGELGAEERAEVERQLAESAELRQELQELQGLVTELRAKLSAETMPRLTETQHRQLQTETVALSSVSTKPALSQSPGTSRQRRIRRWAILGAELACGLAFGDRRRADRARLRALHHEARGPGRHVRRREQLIRSNRRELHMARTRRSGQAASSEPSTAIAPPVQSQPIIGVLKA